MTRLLTLATFLAVLIFAAPLQAAGFEPQNLAGRPVTVQMNIAIEGNARVPSNPLVEDSKVATLPIQATVEVQYEERSHYPTREGGTGPAPVVERYFEKATSSNRVNRSRQTITLRPEAVRSVSHRQTLPEVTYAPGQPLRRDELELMMLPVASVDLDLLVNQRLIVNATAMPIDNATAASVFNLSSIDRNDLKIGCVSASGGQFKYEVSGNVTGHVDGVGTSIRVVGKLTADAAAGCITWGALAIHETRNAGVAEPGYDAKFTIRCTRTPTKTFRHLSSKPAPQILRSPAAEDLLIELDSPTLGVTAMADRRWRVMRDVAGEVMLRMVDADQSIAQCRLLPLPPLTQGASITLEQFKNDVRKQLGDQFDRFVGQSSETTTMGLDSHRVVAVGTVSGVPIRWVMVHLADPDGNRVAATWTMAADRAEQLAGTDEQMIQTMTLRGRDVADKGTDSGLAEFVPAQASKDPSGRLESWTEASQEVAEVASASDKPSRR